MRCAPQVAGAVRDTIAYARSVAERELAAAIDNPVVLEDGLNAEDLLILLAHDSDPFNQWEAAQQLCLQAALKAIASEETNGTDSKELLEWYEKIVPPTSSTDDNEKGKKIPYP